MRLTIDIMNGDHPAWVRRIADSPQAEPQEERDAGSPGITLWGRGSPSREFPYVEGAADEIVQAIRAYGGAEPINPGRGAGNSIRDLVWLISAPKDDRSRVVWDTSMPNGQRRLEVVS